MLKNISGKMPFLIFEKMFRFSEELQNFPFKIGKKWKKFAY